MKKTRKIKQVEVRYEYTPDSFSEAKLNEVYFMLFEEIKELIALEEKIKTNKITN